MSYGSLLSLQHRWNVGDDVAWVRWIECSARRRSAHRVNYGIEVRIFGSWIALAQLRTLRSALSARRMGVGACEARFGDDRRKTEDGRRMMPSFVLRPSSSVLRQSWIEYSMAGAEPRNSVPVMVAQRACGGFQFANIL